jgi:hypothetical protein
MDTASLSFISIHNIDVMLISLYFTAKSYLRLKTIPVYHTNNPARTALGGTAIIINKFHQASPSKQLQSHPRLSVQQSIPTGDPDASHSEHTNYSK